MEMDTVSVLYGIIASLITQAIKRQHAGPLENFLVAAGGAYAVTNLPLAPFGDPNTLTSVLSSYAWHGAVGTLPPMQAIKFGTVDRLVEGVGKAFDLLSSRHRGDSSP